MDFGNARCFKKISSKTVKKVVKINYIVEIQSLLFLWISSKTAKKSSKTIRSFIYSLSFLRLPYTNTDRLAIKVRKKAIKRIIFI